MPTTSPLISIILPVYNVEEYISECVDSILYQTYKNIEVLIVDDCGNDGSIPLAEQELRKSGKIPYKIIKHTINAGQAAARNTGMKHATGSYIFFLDPDDYIKEDAIELLLKKAQETNAELVIGSSQKVYSDGHTESFEIFSKQIDIPLFEARMEGVVRGLAWNRLISREFLNKCKNRGLFTEGIVYEDALWMFWISLSCQRFATLDKVTYFYRIRENSTMSGVLTTPKKVMSEVTAIIQYTEAEKLYNLKQNSLFRKFYASRYADTLHFIMEMRENVSKKADYLHQLLHYAYIPEDEIKEASKVFLLYTHFPSSAFVYTICHYLARISVFLKNLRLHAFNTK